MVQVITPKPIVIEVLPPDQITVIEVGMPGSPGKPGERGPRGLTGATPQIEIVEVITVDWDEEASAELSAESTSENPQFVFRVPRGRDGLGLPVEVSDPQPRDVLMFVGNAWRNEPSEEITDGGNF